MSQIRWSRCLVCSRGIQTRILDHCRCPETCWAESSVCSPCLHSMSPLWAPHALPCVHLRAPSSVPAAVVLCSPSLTPPGGLQSRCAVQSPPAESGAVSGSRVAEPAALWCLLWDSKAAAPRQAPELLVEAAHVGLAQVVQRLVGRPNALALSRAVHAAALQTCSQDQHRPEDNESSSYSSCKALLLAGW